MIKRIKDKLKAFWKKFKKWIIALLIPVALAAPPLVDNQVNPYTQIGEVYEMQLSGETIKIGGEDANNFKPEIHLGKWGDETWIKIKYETDKKIKPIRNLLSNKLKWVDADKEIHFYPLDDDSIKYKPKIDKALSEFEYQLDGGGIEFDIILKQKPLTNKIVFNIETQGLKFYYQPPLNQEFYEEADYCTETLCYKDGKITIERPENVVGSYAVYHEAKKNNKYKAGKAFHIYRPQIIDSGGNKVWGKLNIDEENDILSVEIPQDFLDNAVYPIRHAAGLTLGYTTGGGSNHNSASNDIYSHYAYTASVSGPVTQTDGWHALRVNSGAVGPIRAVIYKDSDDTIVDYGPEQSVPSDEVSPDADFDQAGSVVASADYMVGWWISGASSFNIRYDSGGTRARDEETYHATNAPPSPCPWSRGKPTSTITYSMWVDYTEAEVAARRIIVWPQ